MSEAPKLSHNQEKIYIPKKTLARKTYSREQLLEALSRMPQEKLNWVVFFLRIPRDAMPLPSAPQAEHAQAVLSFMEQSQQDGIEKLFKAILKATPHLLDERGGSVPERKKQGGGHSLVLVLGGALALGGVALLGKNYLFPSARCGDGIVQAGEQCDGTADCLPNCTLSSGEQLALAAQDDPSKQDAVAPPADTQPAESAPVLAIANTTQPGPTPTGDPDSFTPKEPTNTTKESEAAPAPASLRPGLVVYFPKASTKVTSEFHPVLEEVVDTMRKSEAMMLYVEGHADSDGSVASNLSLSRRRAEAVVAYLAKKGISRSRFKTASCAAEVPVADNSSAEGKNQNRRVEIVIFEEKIKSCEPR